MIELDDETSFTIDDVRKLPRLSNHPPEPPSCKPGPRPKKPKGGVPPLQHDRKDNDILLRCGSGSPPPTSDVVKFHWNDGGRGRLRVEGGVLVASRGWRLMELDFRAAFPFPKFVPGGKFVRPDEDPAQEYMVNGIPQGAYGQYVARWLLNKLRTRKLAVDPKTSVSYTRRRHLWKREGALLIDAYLGKKCVEDLPSYTNLRHVYVDFANNLRLRRVRVTGDGSLRADKDPIALGPGDISSRKYSFFRCVISSREMS